MPPVHPGKILKEMYLGPLAITVTQLAKSLDVARRTVSLIINEHSGISPDMALRFSVAFDTSPELWMNIQQSYDLWHASKRVVLKNVRRLNAA